MNDIELTCVDVRSINASLMQSSTKLPEEVSCCAIWFTFSYFILLLFFQSEYVSTRYGKIFVTIQGTKGKIPIVTYPDVGLNSTQQYHGFFNFIDNEPLMESFCCYHINPLGVEENSPTLPTK